MQGNPFNLLLPNRFGIINAGMVGEFRERREFSESSLSSQSSASTVSTESSSSSSSSTRSTLSTASTESSSSSSKSTLSTPSSESSSSSSKSTPSTLSSGSSASTASSDSTPGIIPEFIFTVDTTKPGSASDTFKFYAYGTGWNADIDWGDGSHETLTDASGVVTHVYAASGTYTVKVLENVVGGCPRIFFNNSYDYRKITNITNWGTNTWGATAENAFFNCSNMIITATDAATANTGAITNAAYMFKGCTKITAFPAFDLHSVTTVEQICNGCTLLTSVPAIATTALTYFFGSFASCPALTSFGLWNLRNITSGTIAFNASTLSTTDYSNLLADIAAGTPVASVDFDGGSSKYNAAFGQSARNHLTGVHGWTITDGGLE